MLVIDNTILKKMLLIDSTFQQKLLVIDNTIMQNQQNLWTFPTKGLERRFVQLFYYQ